MKYKLLKWYPSLPKNWRVGMEVGMGDRKTTFSPCSLNYTEKYIDINEVTKNPEYWKEVIVDVTFDGVELNIGDAFYIAKIDDFNYYVEECFFAEGYNSKIAKLHGFTWFSTREKALEYIDSNKLQFTKKDMLEFGKYYHDRHALCIGISYNIEQCYSDFMCNKKK